MADDEDRSNRTQEPTERKLRKAREKGDVPISREAGNMMSVIALLLAVMFVLPQLGGPLAGALASLFDIAGQVSIGEDRQGLRDLGLVAGRFGWGIAVVLAPVLGLLILCAVCGVLLQGETVVAGERLRPQWSRLSPLGGLKRIYSVDALVEFAKSVAKVGVVAAICGWAILGAVTGLWQGESVQPEALPAYVSRTTGLMLAGTAVFLMALAGADILWKRLSWLRKQRMTQQEVRDEHKDSEGDPQIRAKREGLRRARAKRRLAAAVPKATVILTNPTHYAVALRYEAGADAAPVCVAKGTDLMAQQIRALGREHDVPIIENKPLARALYEVAEEDRQIPLAHWQAVAEIIAFVMDLRRNVRRAPPAGSTLRQEP